MNRVYFARLLGNGVRADSGEVCRNGKPGEGVDTPGIPGYEQRIGCYLDKSGAANLRIVMPSDQPGQSVYIGVVGRTGNITALLDWVAPGWQNGGAGCNYCIDLWQFPLDATH